jgi:hypothetical protein
MNEVNHNPASAPVHRLVGQLRELLRRAGEYPRLEPVGSQGKYYTCPLCGEGSIEDERVSEGVVTHGVGLDISIVGIQVFGFGDGVAAMAALIPLALHHLPALLAIADAAQGVQDGMDMRDEDEAEWAAAGTRVYAMEMHDRKMRLARALSSLPNVQDQGARPSDPQSNGTP